MNQLWNVDLHSHTLWSKDCLTSFETIIQLCLRRGIDRIAITDHNTAAGALAMHKIAPDLVIVGEEIMTTEGEILAYFVQESHINHAAVGVCRLDVRIVEFEAD